MHSIKATPAKNVLLLSLQGFMTEDEITKAVKELKAEITKLEKGFTVINDISTMKPASQKGFDMIREAQKYAAQQGMGQVIRVVNDVITKNQWKRKGEGYDALEVNSIDEAYSTI